MLLIPAGMAAGFVHHFLADYGPAYFACLALYFASLWVYIRETQNWEMAYDVAAYQRGRTRRWLPKALIWAPSIIATFVLVFSPVASHITHLGSEYLPRYRIPIPWTIAAYSYPDDFLADGCGLVVAQVRNAGKGRYGVLFFWEKDTVTSLMAFGSWPRDGADNFEPGSEDAVTKEIFLGSTTLICRQQRVSIFCQTAAGAGKLSMYARFEGAETDLPIFYSILDGITPR